MKIDFIADTNFLIYVHEGKELVTPFLMYDFGISFISEVELLGFKDLNRTEESKLKSIISDCFCIEWNAEIKQQTIKLRRKYSIKLPDAIIASTSLVYGVPLLTADKIFLKVKEMELMIIEV